MKISILYISQTGNTDTAADYIVDGILANYPFIQVKPMNIHRNELDLDFVRQSDAVIFGSPVYLAGMSWELKRWFDQTVRLDLSGKLGAAFVTANDPAGGTDTAVMEILRNMILKGMLVFSGTGPKGAHKFQAGAVGIASRLDDDAERFEAFGAGVAEMAVRLFGK